MIMDEISRERVRMTVESQPHPFGMMNFFAGYR